MSALPGSEWDCQGALGIVRAGAGELGLSISQFQERLFTRFCELLRETASRMNLTAHRNPETVMRFLVVDSLTLITALPPEVSAPGTALDVVDVGSGAGVPGIPLKIVRPEWRVRLIESVGKKARYLESTIQELALNDISVSCRRAEEVGRVAAWRDRADLVVARAVAPLPSLLELCSPFARPGGLLALPKGVRAAEEVTDARAAARALHLEHFRTWEVPVELELGTDRVVVLYRKSGPTPSLYPRQVGAASSRPIVDRR